MVIQIPLFVSSKPRCQAKFQYLGRGLLPKERNIAKDNGKYSKHPREITWWFKNLRAENFHFNTQPLKPTKISSNMNYCFREITTYRISNQGANFKVKRSWKKALNRRVGMSLIFPNSYPDMISFCFEKYYLWGNNSISCMQHTKLILK